MNARDETTGGCTSRSSRLPLVSPALKRAWYTTKWIWLCVPATVLLSGCGIPQSRYYASFSADMAGKAQVNIAVDTLLIRDIKGKIDGIDVPHNREMADRIGVFACQQLQGKGYRTKASVFHSVGFLAGSQDRFIILSTDANTAPAEPSHTPCYYDQDHYPEPHNRTAMHLLIASTSSP